MSDPVSFTELEAQHVELLPTRTVLSALTPLGDNGPDIPSVGSLATGMLGLNQGASGADGTSTDGNSGATDK